VPGVSAVALVNASANSFAERDPSRARFDPGTDRRGPLTLMALATRRPVAAADLTTLALLRRESDTPPAQAPGPESGRSRIAVIGDSDFATNSFYHFLGNGRLFLGTVSYLAEREDLIGIAPRTRDLPEISVTNRELKTGFVLAVGVGPVLLALLGALVWWRQR
jgi:ABC-type uncharacterized transport system involved in gliding motility auxiliary subunit